MQVHGRGGRRAAGNDSGKKRESKEHVAPKRSGAVSPVCNRRARAGGCKYRGGRSIITYIKKNRLFAPKSPFCFFRFVTCPFLLEQTTCTQASRVLLEFYSRSPLLSLSSSSPHKHRRPRSELVDSAIERTRRRAVRRCAALESPCMQSTHLLRAPWLCLIRRGA